MLLEIEVRARWMGPWYILQSCGVYTAAAKDERSKLGRDGPVVSISVGRGRGGAKKYTNG